MDKNNPEKLFFSRSVPTFFSSGNNLFFKGRMELACDKLSIVCVKRTCSFHPYEQSAVFDIAKHFGLNYRKVPCVVMFTNINEKAVYVHQLKNDWSQDKLSLEFRRMFDVLSNYPLQDAIIDLAFWDYLNQSESFLRKVLASPISIILGNLIGKYAPPVK